MKALITQRETIDTHGVPIDVLDSTYVKFFEKLDIELIMVSNFHNDIRSVLNKKHFDLVILTGGGTIPSKYYEENHDEELQKNRDQIEKDIMEYSIANKKIIIGICRGMQYINGLYGGKVSQLRNLSNPRFIRVDHLVNIGKRCIKVNNYHNDGIYMENLAKDFKVLAVDKENGVVESFYSNNKKILCVQWHPEREFDDKKSLDESTKIIANFIRAGGLIDESNYFGSR